MGSLFQLGPRDQDRQGQAGDVDRGLIPSDVGVARNPSVPEDVAALRQVAAFRRGWMFRTPSDEGSEDPPGRLECSPWGAGDLFPLLWPHARLGGVQLR